MTQQDQRAAFEAACAQWKENAGHESRLSFASDEDGFLDRKVQALMEFWQAAIAHDRQQRGEPVAWQLIETAPKDGSRMLLRSPGGKTADGFWGAKYGIWSWPYVMVEPTHWMPIPPSPQPAAPAVKESLTVAEPVRVPSDEEISKFISSMGYSHLLHCHRTSITGGEIHNLIRGALSRYQGAQPDIADLVEGMAVSVDVSTNDDDAGHRYFGTVTVVQESGGDKHGVILLVQDAEPNFDIKPAGEPELSGMEKAFSNEVWSRRDEREMDTAQPSLNRADLSFIADELKLAGRNYAADLVRAAMLTAPTPPAGGQAHPLTELEQRADLEAGQSRMALLDAPLLTELEQRADREAELSRTASLVRQLVAKPSRVDCGDCPNVSAGCEAGRCLRLTDRAQQPGEK